MKQLGDTGVPAVRVESADQFSEVADGKYRFGV